MEQKKRKKTGGRQAGTPNKTTALTKSVVAALLDEYSNSGMMSKDFKALSAKDRITIAEKMMQYVLPKMQSTAVSVDDEMHETIEDALRKRALENE